VQEFAPKHSARLSQEGDVVLTIFFKHAPVVEMLLPFPAVVVPRVKLLPLLLTHLIHTILRNVGDGTYEVHIFLRIEFVRLQRFGGCQPERLT